MWTPKRVLLLGVGMAFFLVGYGVYAFFLGGIDGLPPLPDGFLAGEIENPKWEEADDAIDFKLRQAFGRECSQVKKTIKIDVRKKGMIIVATQAYFNEPDGRIKLIDPSLALFKDNKDSKFPFPEITTLKSDLAWLKFDQPITSLYDTQKSKMIGAELRGNIVIINNRHTEAKHDDLEVTVNDQPLFYDEPASRIWTEGGVQLLDKQTQPKQTIIKGQGMEMLLTKESPQEKKPTLPKIKSDLSGIEVITLQSTVQMDLYTESSSFLSGAQKPTVLTTVKDGKADTVTVVGKDAKKMEPKSHLYITTGGKFVYNLPHDRATFDSPPPKGNQNYPDQVTLIRTPIHDKTDPTGVINDQLVCDHLVLQFRKKANSNANGDSTERDIESANATADKGMEVVLSLDTDNLAAHCRELNYQCPNAERGPRTVLYGDPLEAVKDGHMIKCHELELIQANQKGAGQLMRAMGPGQVDLFDKNPGKGHTTHAHWKGFLTSTKYRQGDKDLDELTLTKDADFIDDEHDQKLYGQCLKVWLETVSPTSQATPAVQPDTGLANDGPRQRPTKVEAYDNVTLISPDLRVYDCTTFKLRFKDAEPRVGTMLPMEKPVQSDAPPAPATKSPESTPQPGKGQLTGWVGKTPQAEIDTDAGTAPLPPDTPAPRGSTGPDAPGLSPQSEKPKRPINLSARDVVADILRTAEKNDLQELVAEGKVHVKQEGEKEKDKGVDITGETLNLLHFPEGDLLKVYGNPTGPAVVQMNDLILIGPKVTINQKDNSAWADGVGAMHLPPSTTTFDGTKANKPNKPAAPVTVHWTRDMVFERGLDAEFHGSVVAYQGDSTLQCKTLQVALDRAVSFKEGQKGGEGEQAKVEKVVAHGEVRVRDFCKDDHDKFVSSRHLFCTQLAVDNKENRFDASGPGQAASLQYGDADGPGSEGGANAPKKAAAPTKEPELQLTRIDFQDRMSSAYVNDTTRRTTFMGKVYVVHMPADRLDAKVDDTKLPKGGMMMQCEKLIVLQRQLPNDKSTQTMEAQRGVFCRTNDLYARCESLTFDESTDIVTFRGSPGNPAQAYQQVGGPGGSWRKTEALTILYNRKTTLLSVDGSSVINGGS